LSLPSDVYMDRVIWEVVNRVHRTINAEENSAQPGAAQRSS
jgi:hypothetical protein